MNKKQIEQRFRKIEDLGQTIETLMINNSVQLRAIRAALLESESLQKLDPQFETRLKQQEQNAVRELLAVDWLSPERSERLKKLFDANATS
jgi:thioredoxin-like negative regulator of GroEL